MKTADERVATRGGGPEHRAGQWRTGDRGDRGRAGTTLQRDTRFLPGNRRQWARSPPRTRITNLEGLDPSPDAGAFPPSRENKAEENRVQRKACTAGVHGQRALCLLRLLQTSLMRVFDLLFVSFRREQSRRLTATPVSRDGGIQLEVSCQRQTRDAGRADVHGCPGDNHQPARP